MMLIHIRNLRRLLHGAVLLILLLGPLPLESWGQTVTAPQGIISIQLNSEFLVHGNLLEVRYRTSPGTLQGPVDLYFAVAIPNHEGLLFLQNNALSLEPKPFRTNVTIVEERTTLIHIYPTEIPFGTYACYMALVHAGRPLSDANPFASPIAVASFTFAALSQEQLALVTQRGKPDLLTFMWIEAQFEKRETWYYYSGTPTQYSFVNGELKEQSALLGSAEGTTPQIDPSLLTPTTTLDQLSAALGPPTGVAALVTGSPDYQTVSFAVGLDAVFFKGRLIFGRTSTP